ncbi:MAG: DPP IV N-terminal domain-containing protein [Actinomycetota bacterium]
MRRRAVLHLAVGSVALAACSDNGKSSSTTGGSTPANVDTIATTIAESTTTTISPDKSKILYISDQGKPGVYQLWVMNADGSEAHAITNGPNSHHHPSWSPDGKKIVFSSDSANHQGIFVVNADGSGEAQLTTGGHDQSPSWSPDGTKIVYDTKAPGPVPFLIWVMNADGTGQVRLTSRSNDEYNAVFSPDGTKIAFAVQNRANDIYVIGVDGKNIVQLTTADGEDDQPAWSPDSKKIAFSSNRDDGVHAQIYVMNADGTGQLALTSGATYHFFPSWSPDGKRIAFDAGDTANYSTFEIWTMNADGTGAKAITANTADDGVPSGCPRPHFMSPTRPEVLRRGVGADLSPPKSCGSPGRARCAPFHPCPGHRRRVLSVS